MRTHTSLQYRHDTYPCTEPVILTTEHGASSHGLPVLISGYLDGQDATPYGPSDLERFIRLGPGRDGALTDIVVVVRLGTDEADAAAIEAAGFPVYRQTDRDVREIGHTWAVIKRGWDQAVQRGEVDW